MFFRKTLDSLANQTDKRFRVYIGDDASPENPSDLLEEYGGRLNIKYKRFETNVGGTSLVKQWDRCIELISDEEWIMILGDDDYFGTNVIDSFYRHSNEFLGKVNVVRFARQNILDHQNIISDIQINPEWEKATDSYYRRITGQAMSTLSEYAFTRETYEKHGFYEYALAWQSDNRAWLEFPEEKPIFSINDAVVNVIRSSESISGSNLYGKVKREVNLSFFRYLITKKLHMFNKIQSTRILHKYENEMKHDGKVLFKEYLFLLPYYLKNYDRQAFKSYLKKMTKTILYSR